MKILAVEFSSEMRCVTLLDEGRIVAEVSEARSRVTIALVEKVLTSAGWEREAVEAIAVGLGPGSYTGIRGAIAFAQGWQLGRGVKLIGIGSGDVIIAQAKEQGLKGSVNVVIDAQRNEFYLARFQITNNQCDIVEPLRLAAQAEIESRIIAGEQIVGPELESWFPKALAVSPSASTLAMLAAGRTDYVSGDKLVPIYLRETNFKKAPPLRILP